MKSKNRDLGLGLRKNPVSRLKMAGKKFVRGKADYMRTIGMKQVKQTVSTLIQHATILFCRHFYTSKSVLGFVRL